MVFPRVTGRRPLGSLCEKSSFLGLVLAVWTTPRVNGLSPYPCVTWSATQAIPRVQTQRRRLDFPHRIVHKFTARTLTRGVDISEFFRYLLFFSLLLHLKIETSLPTRLHLSTTATETGRLNWVPAHSDRPLSPGSPKRAPKAVLFRQDLWRERAV